MGVGVAAGVGVAPGVGVGVGAGVGVGCGVGVGVGAGVGVGVDAGVGVGVTPGSGGRGVGFTGRRVGVGVALARPDGSSATPPWELAEACGVPTDGSALTTPLTNGRCERRLVGPTSRTNKDITTVATNVNRNNVPFLPPHPVHRRRSRKAIRKGRPVGYRWAQYAEMLRRLIDDGSVSDDTARCRRARCASQPFTGSRVSSGPAGQRR